VARLKIGKLTTFTQQFLRECKKHFNQHVASTEIGSWELFILQICEDFCEKYKDKIPEELKLRNDFYDEWPYNPDYFRISESSFQEYKKWVEKQ
jgi:hypothetical protein